MKPALSRGEIYLISATTADEFMIIERKDPAMERRLQPVYVDELDKEASILVLKTSTQVQTRIDIEIPNDAIKGSSRIIY